LYKTIVLDCQAKIDNFICEDCIAFKECNVGKKTNERIVDAMEVEAKIIPI
jgi:hypothetical protein